MKCLMHTIKNLLISAGLLSLASVALAVGATSQPNILLIMSDDMGFGDTSTFGGAAQTSVRQKALAIIAFIRRVCVRLHALHC